jgi:DNA-binding LytR/AlgR family response regulator
MAHPPSPKRWPCSPMCCFLTFVCPDSADPHSFWQIHRGTVVNVNVTAIDTATATRGEVGKLWLQVHGKPECLAVSRVYAYLFKAM